MVRGGVTAIGLAKGYPTYADETIQLFDVISVSAGVRGLQILLNPTDYLRATGAILAALSRAKGTGH